MNYEKVSWVWTLLFGFLYFGIKGWWKSALVALVLGAVTAGWSWLVIVFFCQQFVEKIESW